MQWLEVVCKITAFSRFCEVTEEHLNTNEKTKLKDVHCFVTLKKLENAEKPDERAYTIGNSKR